MEVTAVPSPGLSAIISYIAEAVRERTFFTGKGAICAIQIWASVFAGAFASRRLTEHSQDLFSSRQLGALGGAAVVFAALRKVIGYELETFASNFGYALAVATPAAVITGTVYSSSVLRGIATSGLAVAGGSSNLVPFFPTDPTLAQPFAFPSLNPGCGTPGQLAAGDGTLYACRVPRLAHQTTFVV